MQVVVSSGGGGHVGVVLCVGTLNWEVFTAKMYCFPIVEIPDDECVHCWVGGCWVLICVYSCDVAVTAVRHTNTVMMSASVYKPTPLQGALGSLPPLALFVSTLSCLCCLGELTGPGMTPAVKSVN